MDSNDSNSPEQSSISRRDFLGGELLDKIGPAIIQVHSAGGPFSWLVANARPSLVKAILNVEGAGAPFTGQTPWG
jgi:hypothetical protein